MLPLFIQSRSRVCRSVRSIDTYVVSVNEALVNVNSSKVLTLQSEHYHTKVPGSHAKLLHTEHLNITRAHS